MLMHRARRMAVAALAAGVLLVGCGAADEEDNAAKPVKAYLNALAEGDGARACEQLTGRAQRELIAGLADTLPEAGVLTCEEAVEQISGIVGPDEADMLSNAEIKVTLDGDRAKARVVEGTDTVDVVKFEDGWLIDGGFVF